MSYNNKTDLFNFLVLVSLFCRIRGEFGGVEQQRPVTFGLQLGNNFSETPSEATITPAITVAEEKFDDNEPKKLFIRKFKRYYNFARNNKDLIPQESCTVGQSFVQENNSIVENEKIQKDKDRNKNSKTERKVRDIFVKNAHSLECYECDSAIDSLKLSCYHGTVLHKIRKCPGGAQCFVELHPLYIKRGCLLPNRMNRTFVCKCPLCNDKPTWNLTFFTYTSLRDWKFDNHRLLTPIVGINPICKSCETGENAQIDGKCRKGDDIPFMTCSKDSVCYTSIDQDSKKVSRGCMSIPVQNSIYFFCNTSYCNSETYQNPVERENSEHPLIKRILRNHELQIKKTELESPYLVKSLKSSNNSWMEIGNSQIIIFSFIFSKAVKNILFWDYFSVL